MEQDQFEKDRVEAGFCFLRFSLHPLLNGAELIESVQLRLDALSGPDANPAGLLFRSLNELLVFVDELRNKLAAGLPCGFWRGYELELSDFSQLQLDGVVALLGRWQSELFGTVFDGVFDLAQYGQRVIGFGVAQAPISPFLLRKSGQQWLPAALLDALGMDGALLAKWDTDNPVLLAQLEQNIAQAQRETKRTVLIPGLETIVPLGTGQAVVAAWADKLQLPEGGGSRDTHPEKSVLLIEHNIEVLDYVERRAAALQQNPNVPPILPGSLLPDAALREHQQAGVAWLQHLFICSPSLTSGCLLADDMGLGKTLQLLTFIAWHLEQPDCRDPVLIVAPVSLLDNWENELRRFFKPGFTGILKLYGHALASLRFPKKHLPPEIKARGVYNLLIPDWRRGAQIILTTYETLRDLEFSLARQHWSIVVCDEAQKIKNPAALVTQTAKALPARFKIACTGTPVENSLTDLWCLFDFIQPGHLGALNDFGKKYRQPANTRDQSDLKSLDELRALIAPQILRRMKADIAKDLPKKFESNACKHLLMSSGQLQLYKNEIANFKQRNELVEKMGGNTMAILGLLHTMKMICAHPASVAPDVDCLPASPKMLWLMQALGEIKELAEKVIIFTELRDIQRTLQLAVLDQFGLHVRVINGDTSASGNKGVSRQSLIDDFQAQPGFGIILDSSVDR